LQLPAAFFLQRTVSIYHNRASANGFTSPYQQACQVLNTKSTRDILNVLSAISERKMRKYKKALTASDVGAFLWCEI